MRPGRQISTNQSVRRQQSVSGHVSAALLEAMGMVGDISGVAATGVISRVRRSWAISDLDLMACEDLVNLVAFLSKCWRARV